MKKDDCVIELRSDRLVLRPVRAGDAANLLMLASDPGVLRFMHEGPSPSAAEMDERIERAEAQWAMRRYGMMAVFDRKGFVGRLGFVHPPTVPEPLLVYALLRRAWGTGYATEGCRSALGWLGDTHAIGEVAANIDPDNGASARVAEKLGARRDGQTILNGAVLDRWIVPTRGPE